MYTLQTHRELIDGDWYYFLFATHRWHLYVWIDDALVKVTGDIVTLQKCKEIAYKFAEIRKDINNG